MSKKIEFVNFIIMCVEAYPTVMPEGLESYWEAFKNVEETEKPLFTDNGKVVLKFMQEHIEDMPLCKAKDLGEQMGMSSRIISGTMRKLVTDNYVEKVGQDPVIYALTEKGRTIEII